MYNIGIMIRLLEGVVAGKAPGGLVISVGGVGYHVRTTKKVPTAVGVSLRLFTHLAVRETALDLYGFLTETELEFFELLLTIPKIGPKSALQILDQADVALIVEAVNLQDASHLSKLSGIGNKTAEKIVLTLKDKVAIFKLTNTGATAPATQIYTDAFDTLITLGYNPMSIRQVLDTINDAESTSNLVRLALKELS